MNIYIRSLNTFKTFLGSKRFYFVIIFGIITSAFIVGETFMASRIIAVVEDFIKNGTFSNNSLYITLLLWVILVIITIILQYIYRFYLVDRDILRFYVNNLNVSAKKSLHIPFGIYLQKKSGETFKRLEKGREGFMSFYFFFYLNLVKDISGILIVFFLMLYTDITMTFITLSGLPIAVFIGYFFNKKTLYLQNENNEKENSIFGLISDSLSNFGLMKILNLESSISQKFEKTENELLTIQEDISKRWAVANVYIGSLVALLRIIVTISGFYFLQKGTLNFSDLFLFFILIGWVYFPLGNIFGQMRQIQRWGSNMKEFYAEFEDTIQQEDLDFGKTINKVTGNISFNDVTFGYTKDKNILKNISFDIKKGQKIALVGNTGAGKSTIVNLILRFWEVDSGNITLDGNNISEITKSSLRSHIGVVSQDNSLFNLSIEENLKFAKPKATKKEIEVALINAEAGFVFELKHGIKTVIGERGLKLSGGEKQRISIARLFLKNPEILLLDEATSALDNTTEAKIEKALRKLMKGKTSIIIAHRLSTIRHADNIYMLENGKIVESGNYEQLMKEKGKFYNLASPDKLILG